MFHLNHARVCVYIRALAEAGCAPGISRSGGRDLREREREKTCSAAARKAFYVRRIVFTL